MDSPNSNPKLTAALIKAQSEFPPINKKRVAKVVSAKGSYAYKYADLADVLKAITPHLYKNGLTITHRTEVVWSQEGSANLMLVAELSHESGEKIASHWPVPVQQQPQQTGAILSYYRRFSVCMMTGVAAEEEGEKTEEGSLDKTQGNKPVTRRKPHSGQIPTTSNHSMADLKAWVREFVRDIHACSDADELDALVSSSADMAQEVQKNLSNWWFGDSRNPDFEPVPSLIERRAKELREAANE